MSSTKFVKAYNNTNFLNSPPARIIRILSEMIEPETRFRKYGIKDTVVFFGSAKILPAVLTNARLKKIEAKIKSTATPSVALKREHEQAERDVMMSQYYNCAAQLSEKLTEYFKTLRKRGKNFMVCSGGGPGIMAAANYGAKKAGGRSIGLNISLPLEQYPNPFQDQELSFEFHYFFIRKFWFFYLAKALVVFPGGFGTMDELFELLTLMQTGKSRKRMSVILFGSDYWNTIINFDKMVEWGTIAKEDLKLFRVVDEVEEAFSILKTDLERFNLNPIPRTQAEA
ncbi:MAG: TIGR00730 family Rossman fold protein [Candidatus Omnitrophica bacterium]|nr:TIGR00730 family Rossman fold protein [Candidatus Omnitrophota bacterium]